METVSLAYLNIMWFLINYFICDIIDSPVLIKLEQKVCLGTTFKSATHVTGRNIYLKRTGSAFLVKYKSFFCIKPGKNDCITCDPET